MFFIYILIILIAVLFAIWWNTIPRMTKCRTCGKDISKNAKQCPHCGAPTPGAIAGQAVTGAGCGILLAPFIIVAVVLFVVFTSFFNDSPQKNIEEDYSKITLAEFQELKTGMSYDDCVNIIGSYGTVSAEMTAFDVTTTTMSFEGNASFSSATLTFQNGKLTSKMQYNLK